ncbi:hypothetical protein DUI87_01705 [Hirundo rustica rustica]|uniref:ribonuclease H n=1 Tax=Hirundo rustica rustica TaxID=333673 RepID=A0A3M0L5A7_HIRRU|nr:hypothetical protein DUI87_01705 [Hirundo rustica rustica]
MYGSWLWLFTLFVGGGAEDEALQSFVSFFSSESVKSLLENFEFPLSVKETIFLVCHLVSLLYTVCSFSRIWAEISRGADKTPDPGRGNPEWCGEWEDMGQLLKEFSDPIVWDFPQEQIQNPVELGKYLKERYHDGSKGEKMAAVSWALAYAYRTLMPSRHVGAESVSIAGVTGGSQDFTLVEADVSLTGKELEKHPIVTGPEAPCILGIDYLQSGYFKDPKGLRWAFGIAAVVTEGIRQLNTLPGLSENPSAVGLLKVQEQWVPIATSIVHRRQYRTTRDAVIPIHKMIQELESQGVVSKTHSPFNSPMWPVRKSEGEWRLTVDCRALNEVTPPLSAAVPDMLELQYELESKTAKWYATIDIANAFFSIPLAAECRPQFAFTWRGVQYTWNRLPQGWKHSPTICHGLIQTALEKGEAPEHLQYIDDIIVWGNTAAEVFEKGKKILQILLEAGFAIKKSKVKGPAHEIQFLGVKWQDGWRQIPTEVINKITAMSPPTNKKETQAFLGTIGFWRMHIPEYSQIVSPLYLVTRKKNDFHWGPEQQQAFAQIKQEIARAVALGPVRTGPDVKNVLYSAAGNNGLSWSLWQKVPGETRGRPLGFWSRSYRGSEANYTPTEKEILAAYEGVQAASEVIGMNRKRKAAVWSPTRQVAEATEEEGGSSQLAELKAVQLALDIAEREGWPRLYLYTDSWMVANALWGWLKTWKEANWQHGGKPIWAAKEWKDIATRVERLPVKVRHVDAHVPKSRANEECRNNKQVD